MFTRKKSQDSDKAAIQAPNKVMPEDARASTADANFLDAMQELVSQKAALDDASWGRVEQIAELLLSGDADNDDVRNLAAELALIAQVNAQLQRSWSAPQADEVRKQMSLLHEQAAEKAKAKEEARAQEERKAREAAEAAAREAEEAKKKAEEQEAARKAVEEEAKRQAEAQEAEARAKQEAATKAAEEKAANELNDAAQAATSPVPASSAASGGDKNASKPGEPKLQEPAITGAAAIEAITSEAPTFEDSKLPDWAQHDGDGGQEALNAFFAFEDNEDKGRARKIPVVIPRGETGSLPPISASGKIKLLEQVESEPEPPAGEPDFAGFDKMATSNEPIVQAARPKPEATTASKGSSEDAEAPVAKHAKETWSQRRERKKRQRGEEKAKREAQEAERKAKREAREAKRKAEEAAKAKQAAEQEAARKAQLAAEQEAAAAKRKAEEAAKAKQAAEQEAARKAAEQSAATAKRKAEEAAAANQEVSQEKPQAQAATMPADAAGAHPAAASEASSDETQAGSPGSQVEQPKLDLSSFREVYASRDGSIALYEDSNGHITAVNLKNLAN